MGSGEEKTLEETVEERLEKKGFTCIYDKGRFRIYEKRGTNMDKEGNKREYVEKIIYDSEKDELITHHKFYNDAD